MKRLMQSGFAVGLLLLLVVIGVINTAQLHNLESRVGAIEKNGVATKAGPAVKATATSTASALAGTTCYSSAEEETASQDAANILDPLVYPSNWPAEIARAGTLKRQVASDPPGLNLLASNNAADLSEFYRYIGSKVALQSPWDPDHWYADLATKVTKSEDGLTYDIYLRSGVPWQAPAVDTKDPRYAWLAQPHEVVADDFLFTLQIIQNPQVVGRAANLRTYFESWKAIEVVDDHHFRVHFTENLYINQSVLLDLHPTPRWLYLYDEDGQKFDDATWGEKQNSHWYNQKGIGTGPFRFVSWEPGVKMTFERNPSYHLNKCLPANFDGIEISMLKDQAAWLRYLASGKLDYTQVQPAQFVAEIKDKKPYLGEEDLELLVHQEASYFYFGWNQARPMFQDKRVRRALTQALDRQGLVDGVFGGLGTVTSGPFDQGNPCYDPSIAPWPYDLDAAATLLDEAGWTDTDGNGIRDKVIDGKKVQFEFTLVTYGGSTEYENLASVYGQALQRIGIKMTPQPLEWAAQLKKTAERDFDAYSGAWVPGWEIDLFQLWHSSEADKPQSSNYVSFRNPDGDRIAEALRREFDPAARTALCHEFHALVHEEQPYTFFDQRKRPMLYWDRMNEPVISKMNPHRDARLMSFSSAQE
jgi:ABC-type transport system substrate-binding protein